MDDFCAASRPEMDDPKMLSAFSAKTRTLMASDDEFDYEAIAAQEREEKKDVTKAESLSEAFECFGASTDDVYVLPITII